MIRPNAQGARNLAIANRIDQIELVLSSPDYSYDEADRLLLRREQLFLVGHWRKLEALCAIGLVQPTVTPPHEIVEGRP